MLTILISSLEDRAYTDRFRYTTQLPLPKLLLVLTISRKVSFEESPQKVPLAMFDSVCFKFGSLPILAFAW